MGAAAQRIDVSKIVLPVGTRSRNTIKLLDSTWTWLDQVIANTEKATGEKLSYGDAIEYLLKPMMDADQGGKK